MIPKLALNFLIDSVKEPAEKLLPLFDIMSKHKIIYAEVILSGITSIEQLEPYMDAFNFLRTKKHVDYTVWIDVDEINDSVKKLIKEARLVNRLVMGVASTNAAVSETAHLENIPYFIYDIFVDHRHDLMALVTLSDEEAMRYGIEVVSQIHAPEGMRRGLQRVIEDYASIGRERLGLPEQKPQSASERSIE